jgi:aerobic carbon-monoxide dehydrogenase medium subunit
VKPRSFTYHRPERLSEATALLAEHAEDAKILAGGQSLLPMLNFRLASPAHLVDVNRISAIGRIEVTDSGVAIGAGVRQRSVELSPDIALGYPLITSALRQVAHLQIRNRGTVCGSLAHADAAAELPAVMVALGAQLVARSSAGQRLIPAADFFEFHLGTALRADELLVEVRVPAPPAGSQGCFVELARRRGDFALVGVAAQVHFDTDGRVNDASLVFSGVAPTPLPLPLAAEIAIGSTLEDELLAEVQEAVRRALDPPGDVHASGAYRRQVAGTLARRALASLRDGRRDGDD